MKRQNIIALVVVWSSSLNTRVQCLNTENMCPKKEKSVCSFIFNTGCLENIVPKPIFKHSFKITSSLFLNNKTRVLGGNWVIILKMVRAHLVRYVSSLPLTIIPKSLHAKSQSPLGQLFLKIKHKYQTHIFVF